MQVNVKVGAVKIAKSYKATLAVITQRLSLHYVFISCNMKPHFLEFMYLEREDSYTRQVCRTWLQNLNFKFEALRREKKRGV